MRTPRGHPAEEKDYPRITPEDLGTMGYDGEESMYVRASVLQAAASAEGLALDFYKSCFAPKKWRENLVKKMMKEEHLAIQL